MELVGSFLEDSAFSKEEDYDGERRSSKFSQKVNESQLEECVQRNNEEMQALAVEMDDTYHRLEMQHKILQYKDTISNLHKKLNSTKQKVSQRDKSLEKFQSKLNRLRIALIKEVDKIKRNEQNTRLKFDLLKDSVLQYKSSAISKDQLFSILEEMQCSPAPPSSPSLRAASISNASSVTITNGEDRDRKSLFRESHFHSLLAMLGEQGECVARDNEFPDKDSTKGSRASIHTPVLDKSEPGAESLSECSQVFESPVEKSPGGCDEVASSLPLLKTSSGSALESDSTQMPPATLTENAAMSAVRPLSSPHSQRSHAHSMSDTLSLKKFLPYVSDQQYARDDTDTDDSDFEMFVPPKRRLLDPSEYLIPKQSIDHKSPSPLRFGSCSNIMSSPALSKRPVWYNRMSRTSLKKSKSEECILFSDATQMKEHADPNGSNQVSELAVLSPDPSTKQKPNPSLVSEERNKKGGSDSSDDIARGTLVGPQLRQRREKDKQGDDRLTAEVFNRYNVVCDEDNDEDDSVGCCTYLDPKDIMEYCPDTVQKKEKNTISITDFDEQTYLTLTDVNGSVETEEFEEKPKPNIPKSKKNPTPPQEGGHYLEVSNTMTRWRRNRELADSSCYSDYSTDTSSGWGENECDVENEKTSGQVHGFKKWGRNGIKRGGHELETDLPEDGLGHSYGRYPLMHQDARDSEIYEAIDDLNLEGVGDDERLEVDSEYVCSPRALPKRHSVFHVSSSDSNSGNLIPFPLARRTAKTLPSSRENLYASLVSITPGSSNWLKNPPSLPPRPIRKLSSLDRKYLKREQLAKETSKMSGIGPLPLYSAKENDGRKTELVNFSKANPHPSLDDIAQPDEEWYSESLYSLGRVLPTTKNHTHHERMVPDSPLYSDISSTTSSTTSSQVSRRATSHPVAGHMAMTTPPSACMVGMGDVKLQLGPGMDPCRGSSSEHVPPNHQDGSEVQSFPFDSSGSLSQNFTPPNKEVHLQLAPSSMSPHWGHLEQSHGKVGYLKMMDDPKLKTWKRRWLVLKDSELRYFKTNKKTGKGMINLDTWCKLTKSGVSEAFQLETSKRCYHLLCKSVQECEDWVAAIEATMIYQQIEKNGNSQKDKGVQLAGWAHVRRDGESQRVWCALKGSILDICRKPDSELIHRINMAESTVRKKRDSILLDSSLSSNLANVIFTIEDSSGVTELQPEENQNDCDSWYYHLCATKSDGMDLKLTNTEKLLSEIEKSIEPLDHELWKHPVFNVALGPLQRTLTTLPSTCLNEGAKRLFQNVQAFMGTKMVHPYDHHIVLVQDIVNTCLKNTPLQDELYCQILRQISGHQPALSVEVTHGWLLLSLIITSFLPTKPKFLWYLQNYLSRCCSSPNSVIVAFAGYCLEAKSAAQEQGPRQCKPSNMEMARVLESFAESGTTLSHRLNVAVYLADGSSLDIEFNPFTTIRGLTSLINESIDMPNCTSHTGFAIMCDWPGVDDIACCCPFPESKVVDVISIWSDELLRSHPSTDNLKVGRYQRSIQLTYKRRLFLRSHVGSETDKEAVLLAYQISKSVHSGEYTIPSLDKAVSMAAMLAQIEHGNWNSIAQGKSVEEVIRDVVMLFCPWKLTYLALDHDISLLQCKLAEYWERYAGMSRHECARKYISLAQEWSQYGSTRFPVEEYISGSTPQRSVWLSVSETGVTILGRDNLKVLGSYSYNDISTFGGNKDECFMLVVFSQFSHSLTATEHHGNRGHQKLCTQDSVGSICSFTSAQLAPQGDVVEKLIFSMPRLKIFDVTFLIASYIEVNRSQAKQLNS